MENMDLSVCGSPASLGGTEHELSSGGRIPKRCVDEDGDCEGCFGQTSLGTNAVVAGGSADAVEQPLDGFNIVGDCPLPGNGEVIWQSVERSCTPPCNDNAAFVDPKNGAGASVPVRNGTECDHEADPDFARGKGRFRALECDPDVGISNIGPVEESAYLCLTPSGVLVGRELPASSHIVAGVEGGVVHFEGDKGCMHSELAAVRSSRLATVSGVEGGIVYFDRDEDGNVYKFATVRQPSLATDCSSTNSNSNLMNEFQHNSLPQDNNVTSISSRTKWIDETSGNSSEDVQSINSQYCSDAAEVPCVIANHLELVTEKPNVDTLDEQCMEKDADAFICSEERDHVSIHSEEKATVVQVLFENEICQASAIERESRDLVQCLSGAIASSCTSKELASVQKSHLCNGSEDCSSRLPSITDHKHDTVAVSMSSICCGSAAYCFMHVDNGGKSDLKPELVSVVRESTLTTDSFSINGSSQLMDGVWCNSLPQDSKVTSVSARTELTGENFGNYSEPVQSINIKDDSEVAEVPCLVGNCLEWAIKKPSVYILDEQPREKESDAPTYSEERDIHVSTHSERETAAQVCPENDMCQASSFEGASCDLVQCLPGTMAPSCARDELALLQQSHLGNATVCCPSQLPSDTDRKGDTVAVSTSSSCCGTAVDCCMQADKGGKADVKSESVLVVRRRNPKRAASSKNNQYITKSEPLTESSSAKRGKQAVNIRALLCCGTFKRVTKKRCRSFKRARVSVWGELGNLLDLFKHNREFSQSKSKRSKKGRSRGERGKRQADRRAVTSRGSRAKHTVSTNHVILVGQMDQQPTLAYDSSTSLQTEHNDCSHSSYSPIVQGLPKEVNGVGSMSVMGGCNGEVSCHYKGMENQVISHEHHVRNGDKDPESSVTQEASVENTVSDSHGIQFQVGPGALLEVADGRLHLDPGTSPDSGVLHPTADDGNIANEGATSTSQVPSSKGEVMGQNVLDPGYLIQEKLHAVVLDFSQVPRSVPLQSIQQHSYIKKAKRIGKASVKKNGKIEGRECLSSDNYSEGKQQGVFNLLKAEKTSRNGSRQRKKGSSGCRKVTNRRSTEKASEDIQKDDRFPEEHSFPGITELAHFQESLKSENCLEKHSLSAMGTGASGLGSVIPENLSSSSIAKGQKLHKGTKTGGRKSKLTESNSAQHRRREVETQKKNNTNSYTSRRKAKQKMVSDKVAIIEEHREHDVSHAEQGGLSYLLSRKKKNLTSKKSDELADVNTFQSDQLRDVDESNSGNEYASKHALSSLAASVNDDLATKVSNHGSEVQQILPKRSAWVRCDDCYKWRFIPVELADIIDETNCRWTCKDNSNKAFAKCTIPQEKTNAQINAELEISDASCEEDSFTEQSKRKGFEMKSAGVNTPVIDAEAAQQSSWVLIKNNIFLHRTRKTQTVDEIMVCQCKSPLHGGMGCGDECLNRMLNIECVPGTCPCGNLCSNQQFQRRKYAKFKWFRCGKKGFGLQLLEDVSQGQFLIEYVGEVLDLMAYEGRQREYASRGQKHFYFMTLNGNEVIDACAKGNLGRFINHSCEPNCRTEKWMVNGEVCIGLFAMRDIKKGEEVTFDYNYVRVFGAAAKRCVCGSAECRGYIGGDPLNTEVIVQGDSDEEYPEPVMIREDGEMELYAEGNVPESSDATDLLHDTLVVGPKMDITSQSDDASPRSSSDGQLSESLSLALKSKAASHPFLDDNKCIPKDGDNNPHASGSLPRAKTSHSISVKKKSCSSNKSAMQKGKRSSAFPVSQSAVCRTGHFEGVEEKLNELLDSHGGISKRRDATKGYLKLLFLTAASGDNVKNEASQSTRDLSLILDALLKTKSRTVLVDIMNKNGLQMLHNIMKQNRKNFSKIPIIRKLLKVLEFLAVKEILTPEHINNIPSHAGVESFKESIIKLTFHNDIQVHQMARNFRDKWLPRTIRKVHLSDRENGRLNLKRASANWFLPLSFKRSHIQGVRDTDAICVSRTDHAPSPLHGTDVPSEISSFCSELPSTSTPSVDLSSTAAAKPRKRKSRWDQPSDAACSNSQISVEEHTAGASHKVMRFMVRQAESDAQCTTISNNGNTLQGIEEIPPGFGPPPNNSQPWIQSDMSMVSTEVAAGHPQERYRSLLTVSYGIPLVLVEQLGTADTEFKDSRHHQSWAIAPGTPFHPFPPLPPFPRGGINPATGHSINVAGSREETRVTDSAPSQLDTSIPIVPVEGPLGAAETGAADQQLPEKVSWSPNGFGKRFFRSDRWNNRRYEKFRPPWPRERNGCRFRGSMRSGVPSVAVGSIQKKMGRGSCFSEGVRGGKVSSTFSELLHQVQ